MVDSESRYSHLLNPIRDLAKNWDVDVAGLLEEYAAELDSITISFDGGATTMNFSEAALIIQSSAAVYSKKVEYLYALVYEVLDAFAKKKKKAKQKASVDADGNDIDAEDEDEDDEWKLITLDDLDEGKNIDLPDDDETNFVPVMPRIPISLLKFDDLEKGDTPLLSVKGEVIGNMVDFKMNTSVITDIGAMLLDLSHLTLLEASLRAQGKDCGDLMADKGSDPYHQPVDTTLTPADDGAPPDLPDTSFGGADDAEPLPSNETVKNETTESQDDERRLRHRQRMRLPSKPKPKEDIWAPVDPYQDTGVDKPLRRAKTWKLPESLTAEAKRKRKRGRESIDKKPLEPFFKFMNMMMYPTGYKPPKDLDYVEFDFHYWPEHERRQKLLKEEKKKWEKLGLAEELAVIEKDSMDEPDVDDLPPPLEDNPFEDEPVENPELRSAMAQAAASSYSDHIERTMIRNYQTDGEEEPPPGSYEELVKKYVEAYLLQAQKSTKLTEQAQRLTEWEDKIIPRLEEEEKHPVFDIHRYGSEVIAAFPSHIKGGADSPVIPFKEIIRGKPAFQVCRYFAATLQLANNYNIEIGYLEDGTDMVDAMTVKLLCRTRHNEELAEYAAPSIQSK